MIITNVEKEHVNMSEICESSMPAIVISDAAVPFVARGGRVFSGQVLASDPGIEDGDEVLVVDRNNNQIATVQVFFGP